MIEWQPDEGFTIAEVLVASGLTMAVAAGAFTLLAAAQDAFVAQPETADAQQRLRVGMDALTRALTTARLVLPYRTGEVGSDASAGRHYRPDVITIVSSVPPHVEPDVIDVYYLDADASTGASQLMHYDGLDSSFPVLDGMTGLTFEYFAALSDAPMDPAMLVDGPWEPDGSAPERFDSDLLSVRRVRVRMRAQSARLFRGRRVSHQEIVFDVSPRNLRLRR